MTGLFHGFAHEDTDGDNGLGCARRFINLVLLVDARACSRLVRVVNDFKVILFRRDRTDGTKVDDISGQFKAQNFLHICSDLCRRFPARRAFSIPATTL